VSALVERAALALGAIDPNAGRRRGWPLTDEAQFARLSAPMNFDLTEEQRLIQQTARDFAAREIAPKAAEIDKNARWPAEIVRRMGELGFMGMAIPTEYGGGGLDTVSYAIAMEEISAACASCGVIMSVNNSLFCDPLYKFGTDEQKKTVLTACAKGDKIGCFGLTEPMSGSDAQTMATSATKTDGGWILSGAKNWITNGPHADYILVFAVTDRSGLDAQGAAQARPKVKHTAFLVPRGTPGYTQNPHDHKLGISGAHSCTVFFDNCKVPDSAVVGKVGEGFKVAMATLDGGRIGIAAQALGIARAALEKAIAYSKERKSFGVTISNHQAIQFMLADMAVELDAARLLTWRAAAMKDRGVRHSAESSEAKLYASEAATRIAHKALQIHGGYGYSTEFPLERHYRDARITEIYEGTSEIQRIVIAASLLKG
jgi:butyryl-CoA dehydrogenase